MTADEIIDDAARRYKFRARKPSERPDDYRAALAEHVTDQDFAAGHEVRVGRRQSDWTQADVDAFRDRMLATKLPDLDFGPGVHTIAMIPLGRGEPTDAGALELARAGLKICAERRAEDPAADLPILVHTVETDGAMYVSPVNERSDRIAVASFLVRTRPVHAIVVIHDAWVHTTPAPGHKGKAEKKEAVMAHVASRSSRVTLIHPYNRDAHGAPVWLDLIENDSKAHPETVHQDPYAALFVTIDAPERPQ